MFCKYCGEQIDDDAKFCPSCGASLARQEADTASVETAASETESAAEIAETTEATEKAEATNALPAQGDAASSEASEDGTTEDAATDASSGAGDSVDAETDAGADAQPGDGAAAEAVKDEDSALTSGGADESIGASGAAETSGAAASDDKQWNISPKSGKTALLLAIFGGVLGLHRFYLRNVWGIFSTVIMWVIGISAGTEMYAEEYAFFILAILALWAIIDIILLATEHYKDDNGRVVLLSIEKYLTARTLEDGSGVEIYAFDVPPQIRCGITALTIPSRIGGVPVVGIADGAFEDCTALRSVKIPRTVTRIGKGAFDGCPNLSLKSQAAIKAVQKRGNISPEVAAKALIKKRWIKIGVIAAASAAAVITAWGVLHKYDVKSYDKGFSITKCRIAAVLGDSEAQFNLAYCYNFGNYTDVNYSKAVKLYTPLAIKGSSVAQNNLGVLYEYGGYGISQDYSAAAMLYRKAAEQDYYKAAYNLARLYARGLGVGQDYDKALEYAKQAYDLGHPDAKAAIRLLTRGKGW